jgi:alpha-N-arabinofuranosidase
MSFCKTKHYIIVFATMMAINGYSQSTITFNVDGATTVIPKEIYGVLMEKLGRQWTGQGAIFVGTNSTVENVNGMRKDVIDGFKECGVGAAEWPGGCAANGYNWSVNKRPSNDVGVDRFIQFCQLTGAEAVIAGKPTGGDAASNLAFCQYIIDSLKYPLKYFKVGNEVWGCGGNQKVDTYIPNYTANYDKMHTYFVANKISMVAGTDLIGNNAWLDKMVQTIGSQIDGVEVHDYLYFPGSYSSSNPTTAQYWDIVNRAYQKQIAPRDDEIIKILDLRDPQKRIKLIEDEWGDWLQNLGDGWMQQNTVMDALSAGEQLHVFMKIADRLQIACLAQGVSVIHSLININTSGVFVKTPTFYVFKMFKPHHINNAKLVPVTASNIQTVIGGGATMAAVTAFASVDSTGVVNISFTNVDLTDTRKVTVTLTSGKPSYTIRSAEVVTGSAINSCNDFGAAEQVNIKTLEASSYSINGKTLSVTLPTKSIVMIRLEPPTAVQYGSFMKYGAESFLVKAGSHGTVSISSSVDRKTPVTVSLYSADGRTLIDRATKTFEAGTCIIGNHIGKGVYLVKVTGNNVNFTKQVVVSR